MQISSLYQYNIDLYFPELDYKTNLIPYFLIIKQPILKYSTYMVAGVIVNDKFFYKIIEHFSKYKKLDAYLTITTIKNDYSCDVIKDNNYKQWNIVENKKIVAIRISKIDEIPTADDRLGYNLFTMIFVDSKALELDNDFLYAQHENVWYNITVKDLMKLYFDDILIRYQVQSYERIDYSSYKYSQIIIKQDISSLEFPYFIQKHYKLSTGLPVIFYDPFSSYEYFKNMDVYKIYDFAKINTFIKADLSDKSFVNIAYIKTEHLDHPNITKKFGTDPNKVILVYNDATTKVVDVSNTKSADKSKFDDKSKKYKNEKQQMSNPTIYNIHVFDNEQLTIERYKNIKSLFKNIIGINRVRISGDYFMNYDIGVLYKFSRIAKYNSLFHNLCYYFYMLDSSTMTCDVIGDLVEFQL